MLRNSHFWEQNKRSQLPLRTMEAIHQALRLNYTRISESIQTELTFLSELSELTDDERFRQSIAEVIYSLNDLSETIDLQRRYLKARYHAE